MLPVCVGVAVVVVRVLVVALDTFNVLLVLGIDGVIVMEVLLVVGIEFLSITVVNCVFVVVREGLVAEV